MKNLTDCRMDLEAFRVWLAHNPDMIGDRTARILYRNCLTDYRLAKRRVEKRKKRPVPSPPVEKVKIESPYLNVEEAAAYCGLAVRTIYKNRRYIERQPGTRKLLFKREALDKFLATRRKRR